MSQIFGTLEFLIRKIEILREILSEGFLTGL